MGRAKRLKAMRKKIREAWPYHHEVVMQKMANGQARLSGQKGIYRRMKQLDRERNRGERNDDES